MCFHLQVCTHTYLPCKWLGNILKSVSSKHYRKDYFTFVETHSHEKHFSKILLNFKFNSYLVFGFYSSIYILVCDWMIRRLEEIGDFHQRLLPHMFIWEWVIKSPHVNLIWLLLLAEDSCYFVFANVTLILLQEACLVNKKAMHSEPEKFHGWPRNGWIRCDKWSEALSWCTCYLCDSQRYYRQIARHYSW